MADYIYALTGAVLVSELFMLLMPEGKLRRFARTAVGLLLMLMILLPLKNCSLRELSIGTEKTVENKHKISYSDIIMDIYTDAMEEQGERPDG